MENLTTVTTSTISPTVLPSSNTVVADSTTVPEDATAVTLNPATGKVYNAKTGALISDARYDAAMRKIYYRDSNSTFGKVFTDTTGYVNIDLRGMENTYATPSIGDPDFDLLNIDIGGEDLEKFRVEVSTADPTKKVTVRGWDPDKKEEIVGRPEEVKTSDDLNVYIEAVALSDAALTGITIKAGVLELVSREEGKLFWFIPVTMSSHIVVDFKLKDRTSDLVDVKFPWWHVFVKKSYSPSTLEAELRADTTGVFDPTKWEKIDNSEAQTDASRIAQALGLISSVMKTKHDTAKNSISNVR